MRTRRATTKGMNPGRAARVRRRVENSTQRSLAKRLGDWLKARKGQPSYYALRHRRRKARKAKKR